MKQITAGLALAFALMAAACGGSKTKPETMPAAPAGPTCGDVATNTEKQLLAVGGQEGVTPELQQLAAMARDTINERCPVDGWSQEAMTCLANATGETMDDCSKLLTDEQNQKLEESMKQRMHDASGGEGASEKQMAPDGAAPDDPCGGDE